MYKFDVLLKEDNVENYNAIGFDMDHTFIRYRKNELIKAVYKSICDGLAVCMNYPENIISVMMSKRRENYRYGSKCVIDKIKGNFLKLGADGKVLRAINGK